MTFPLPIIDSITDKLGSSESSKELGKNYKTLPLTITNGITNELKFL